MIKRILTFSLLVQLVAAGVAFPSSESFLTLDECVETALNLHPDLAAAVGKINSKRASVGLAASGTRPQVTAGANYTRSDNSVVNDDSGSYSTNVSVTQLLTDWGRSGLGIKGAQINMDAATADFLATRDTVIADVRYAYYGLNLSLRKYQVAMTRYENYRQRLEWARSYYQVGTKARIEMTKAKADLAGSRRDLVQAQSSIEQYRSELATAMGVPLQRIENVTDVLDYEDWGVSVDEALKQAAEKRPELAAQRRRVDYAKTNLQLQMRGKSPEISAKVGYNLYGSAPFDENGWSALLSLSVPIFDGGLTRSRIEGAQADLITSSAQYDSLYNSVVLEVRKAWESLREAKQSLEASMESERYAKETLDLALDRYKAGVGNSLEISDAVETYSAAQTNTILSLYDCKNARLNMEKAMGGL